MKQVEQNGFRGAAVAEEPSLEISAAIPAVETGKQPYVPVKDKARSSLKENGRLLFVGSGLVLVLLLLAFSGLSKKPKPARGNGSANQNQLLNESESSTKPAASLTPILDTSRAAVPDTDRDLVNPDQIGDTASKEARQQAPANLGSVPPFENSWQPPPYRSAPQSATAIDESARKPQDINPRSEPDALDKASLVFVKNDPSAVSAKPQDSNPPVALEVGLAPGTRLRARLESSISTAIPAPIVAVIEYNYEQSGEIVIPAGAKALGHLEAADRSGYVGIRFDSLTMPDGSSASLAATATDLQLRPLRGKLEGKHTGKNILVRTFAGVGEIAATLAGRGSLDQPLSEGDLLRERVSNNIGQASDQTVANLATTEHIVVSIPADTEIYVVLQKPARTIVPDVLQPMPRPGDASKRSIEDLRQLMQLQREINDSAATQSSTQ